MTSQMEILYISLSIISEFLKSQEIFEKFSIELLLDKNVILNFEMAFSQKFWAVSF
jgi:hypothetical protein